MNQALSAYRPRAVLCLASYAARKVAECCGFARDVRSISNRVDTVARTSQAKPLCLPDLPPMPCRSWPRAAENQGGGLAAVFPELLRNELRAKITGADHRETWPVGLGVGGVSHG